MTKIARFERLARRVAFVASMAALQGCVSLLPKTPPVQLYRFGGGAPPAAGSQPPAAPIVSVALSSISLPRAALGDQLLTVTGDEAAYLAGVRWITPAAVMFQEDVEHAFESEGGPVQLVGRGNFATATALLGLDVGDFEVRYDNGTAAPPVILVSVRATLSRPDGQTLAVKRFQVRQAATDNRIAPIVAAFDSATNQALSQIVAWTNAATPRDTTPTVVATPQ